MNEKCYVVFGIGSAHFLCFVDLVFKSIHHSIIYLVSDILYSSNQILEYL